MPRSITSPKGCCGLIEVLPLGLTNPYWMTYLVHSTWKMLILCTKRICKQYNRTGKRLKINFVILFCVWHIGCHNTHTFYIVIFKGHIRIKFHVCAKLPKHLRQCYLPKAICSKHHLIENDILNCVCTIHATTVLHTRANKVSFPRIFTHNSIMQFKVAFR